MIFVVGDLVSGGGIFDALNYAIAPPAGVAIPAPVISISYGFCEQEVSVPSEAAFLTFLRNLAQQANAEGITIFAASGDLGAADCEFSTNTNSPPITASPEGLAVDLPGALPNVTSVGGTEFTEGADTAGVFWIPALGTDVVSSARSYIPEGTWNETNTIINGNPVGLAAGGGGSSLITPKPTWQVGAGVPNDGARDVPDVSLSASFLHDDYLICTENFDPTSKTFSATCPTSGPFRKANGGLTAVGGTSAGPPAMAGIMALINQATNHPGGSGNINPVLYGQPMSQSVIEGQPAMFAASATGTLPLSYQWTKNGAAISGATESSYTTSATAVSNQGDQFSVMVSNSAGSATSNSATLTVNVPYNFVVQVPSTTSTGSGTLTVTAQIGGISHSAQMALTVQ